MNKIIPYNDKLGYSNGGFINLNSEIVLVNHHEIYAREYCYGKDYDFLKQIKYGRSLYSFEDFQKEYNFNGSKEDIDVFASSNLTKEQLVLLKKWLQEHERVTRNLLSDFLVYVVGFDKIETIRRKAITTTTQQPYTKFYNYYLMDWYIDWYKPLMIFNEETGCFEYAKRDYIVMNHEDREVKSEIDEIKANVLRKDRHHFLK